MPTASMPSTPLSSAHSKALASTGTGTTTGTTEARNGDTVAPQAVPSALARNPPT